MRERLLCCFCLFFLVIQMIFVRGFQIGRDLKPSLLEKNVETGTRITVDGKVYHTEVKKDNLVVYLTAKSYQTKIVVYIKQMNSEDEKQNKNANQICIGNTIRVTGEVSYFDAPRNPGNFDQHFYYQKQGIHGYIWSSDYEVINQSKNAWKDSLAKLRIRWKELLVEHLGETNGNTMSAILLGDKSELDSVRKELYQKNGIGHILAISGLHMTFIGIGFYQILRKRGMSFVSAGLIGILFLVSYSMMIGNGVASVRALVMFIIRIGADMTGRVYDMLTALAAAALVILIWRPLYLYDAGFLLSFGAILGILVVYPVMTDLTEEWMKKIGINIEHDSYGFTAENINPMLRIIENVRLGLCGSLSINLAILPCMLYFYFEFPPYSILINLLVIPLMSVVLGAGVLGSLICSVIPLIGDKILWICKLVLFFYEGVCDWCIRLPGSHLVIGQPELWQIIMYYLILAIVLILVTRKFRATAGILSVVAMLILCIRFSDWIWERDILAVTMLDVGQGDGIVVRSPSGLVCMIDGGSSDVKEVGKHRIEPYLKSQGISEIDYAFVSHGDIDHYSGIEEMLMRQAVGVKVKYLVLPAVEVLDEDLKDLAITAIENDTKVVTIYPGEAVTNLGSSEEKLNITCLQPGPDYEGTIGNESSMILSLSYGEFDMLFTGDAEGEGEELLTELLTELSQERDETISYEVLKVAHHGSGNSTKEEFLAVCPAKYALISAGRENRYGHPHADTISRLEETGCSVQCTKDDGAITVRTDGNKMQIDAYPIL